MTLSELLIGRIQADFVHLKSINAVAKHYGLNWRTIYRAIHYKGRLPRAARFIPGHVLRRRKLVKELARKRVTCNGRPYPIHGSATSIQQALHKKGLFTSKATVLRDLRRAQLVCRVRRRVPTREPAVHEKRRLFCASWLRRSKDHKKVVFSDEHTVSINDHTSRTMWVAHEDEVLPRERRRLQNVPRIMVWAAVGIGFKSPIVLFPETAADGDGDHRSFRLNAEGYVRRCLSKVSPSLTSRGRIFQQDGAKPHQNSRVRSYLEKKGVDYIKDWPPYSPDLSFIELMWPLLNRHVAERHPATMQQLRNAVIAAWGSISQQDIDAICRGFKKKLQEVLGKSGRC